MLIYFYLVIKTFLSREEYLFYTLQVVMDFLWSVLTAVHVKSPCNLTLAQPQSFEAAILVLIQCGAAPKCVVFF